MYENGKLWTMNPELLEEATMAEIKAGVLNPVTATKIKHQIGDEVTVSLPLERVKSLQADHGGWKDDMSEILSTTGIVMGMDQDEDLVVKYESGKTYFLNPDLFKSSTKSNHSSVQTECEYKIREWVRVSSDKEHVINLQEDSGLTTKLSTILGKTVRVSDVKSTRIINVKFRGDDYSLDTRVVTKPR
uniref:E3 ubiquitin-protein ligase MIB1-like n=2 Tax=Ciona intestinalis TaxID=7719 RepID=H2XNH7_CIOIN